MCNLRADQPPRIEYHWPKLRVFLAFRNTLLALFGQVGPKAIAAIFVLHESNPNTPEIVHSARMPARCYDGKINK